MSLCDEAERSLRLTADETDMYKLPFASQLLDDALDFRPAGVNDDLTTAELLAWLSSAAVKSVLQKWMRSVVDVNAVRAMIEPGMSIDFNTASDTIDTLVAMCWQVGNTILQSSADAFELTAHYASVLVNLEHQYGSPFHCMAVAGHLHWCYDTAIRLLVTIFHDLTQKQAHGYFLELLGGPAPRPITDPTLLAGMMRVDNIRVGVDSELDAYFTYVHSKVDYSWMELNAQKRAARRGETLMPIEKTRI